MNYDSVSADNSVRAIRPADMRVPPCVTRPSPGGVAAHRQQIEAMLADAETEYRASRRRCLEDAIAAQARIECLQAVRQSVDLHLMRGGL